MSRRLPYLVIATLGSLSAWAEPATAPVDETAMLPVHSMQLSPGKAERRSLDLPGLPALFLVGDDPFSLAWLTKHAARLQRIGAIGLAVEVTDANALRRIRTAAPALDIHPISGDDLAVRLGISRYPVLITTTGLEQ